MRKAISQTHLVRKKRTGKVIGVKKLKGKNGRKGNGRVIEKRRGKLRVEMIWIGGNLGDERTSPMMAEGELANVFQTEAGTDIKTIDGSLIDIS